MRRLFWVALGLGAGVASVIVASRFVRTQTAKVAPANLAREARGSMLDLAKLVSESIYEGKVAMQQREMELRSDLGDDQQRAWTDRPPEPPRSPGAYPRS